MIISCERALFDWMSEGEGEGEREEMLEEELVEVSG